MGTEKPAGWIVRLRYPLLVLMLALAAAAAPNIPKTRINYSLTDYLDERTLTRRGLEIMNREFGATAGMTVALRDEAGEGEGLEAFLSFARELPGMMRAEADGTAREGDVRYTRVSMIVAEENAEEAYDRTETYLRDIPHLSAGGARDSRVIRKSLNDEMPLVMGVSCLIVLAVLLMMSRSFLEPLIFMAVIAVSIVLSMLAVFLLMPGLLVLLTPALRKTRHRQLRIRADALTRLPAKVRTAGSAVLLLLIAAGAVIQTGNIYTYTVRDIDSDSARIAAMFGRSNQTVLLVPACREDGDYAHLKETLDRIGRVRNEGKPAVRSVYAMPVTGETALRYYDDQSVGELLGVPRESAAALLKVLGAEPPIRGDRLIQAVLNAPPLISLFIPQAVREQLKEAESLLALARETFDGENWSRAILEMDISYMDPGAPEALHEIQRLMADAYGDRWAMAGSLTATDDIATSFSGDVQRVSLITILAVFLIVMISFRSVWVPLILVCVIQGAVWINMAFSGRADGSVFFMCYLICMALQMGATIDYGILMTSHYRECRQTMPPLAAAGEALRRSVQTIFTSGLALITAGFAVGIISSVFYISEIGKMLGRGAIVSVLLILLLLPQLLIWLDCRVVSGRYSAETDKPENHG